MVHEPGAHGVRGFAEDEVEGAAVEVGEVGGEALGGAEGAAYLFDGDVVAALRLDAGAGGDADEFLQERGLAVDGVFDFDGTELAVAPFGEVEGRAGGAKALGDGGGEEVVPSGVVFGEPASGSVHDEPLFGVGFVAPGVEGGGGDGVFAGAGFGVLWGSLGVDEEGPEGGAGGDDDGGGRGVRVYDAVPVAEEVGGLMEMLVGGEAGAGGVVDGVGETLGDDVVEVGVDVGLEGEHVGGGELVFSGDGFFGEDLPDALIAIGRTPVEGDGVGVVVGGDAVVGGGEDAVGWVGNLRELVVGDGADPVLGGVEGVGGDGADGAGGHDAAAKRDVADGVVADVALVVGVDEILRRAAEGGEGGDEAGSAGGGVDGEERGSDAGWIVDDPAEGESALFCREDAGDDGGDVGAVLGGGDVEGDVFAAFDVDDLAIEEEGLPDAGLGLVLVAADVLDVDVLDFGAEVGEAPGYVVVVAGDDEGNAGEGDAGDVEVACGGGGFSTLASKLAGDPDLEVGLVPDAGNAVGQVLVVGEERLAGGGVGTGDDPVVGAGEAAFADGVAEGLLEGEEVWRWRRCWS